MADEDGPGRDPMVWSDSYVPARYYGPHPPLDCRAPTRPGAGVSGKYRCPACSGTIRLAGHETAREFGYRAADSILAAVGAALVFPFRRQHEGEVAAMAAMDFWLCVSCKARDGDDVEAEFVLDGASLCGECAAPMIKILAGRMGT
jgi:hypothetical protein